MFENIVKKIIKLLTKKFQLEKLDKIIKYIEEPNELDHKVKELENNQIIMQELIKLINKKIDK